MNIYEKLSKIQSELKAPKGQYNSFGKYNYRNCEDILEAVKPLLLENKVTLVITDNIENIGDRFYVKATAELMDIEKVGELISVSAYAREEETKKGMDGSQVTGASSSYSRKYALNGLFCIDDTKDSDTTNKHGKEDSAQEPTRRAEPPKQKNNTHICSDCKKPVTATQKKTIEEIIEGANKFYKTDLCQSCVSKRYKENLGGK